MARSKVLGACVAAALVLPIVYAAKFPAKGEAAGTPYPSEDSYAVIAANFADHGALLGEDGRPTAHREPVYPMLLGGAFKLLGKSYPVEVAVNVPLNALLIYALFKIGAALFGELTGLIAAALASVHPTLIYYASRPRRETLLALLSVLCVGALVRAFRKDRAEGAALAGGINALAALTNTTFLPFGLLAPLGFFWLWRGDLKKAAARSLLYWATLAVVYAPWPLRNYAVFHRWIAGTAGAGGTVFYVNQIVPAELGGLPQEVEIVHDDPVYQRAQGLDPIEVDRYFWKAGMARAKEDPGRFLRLALRRFFVDEWRITPRARPSENSAGLVRWAAILSDGWIIPLGLIGLLFLWRLRPPESAWIALLLLSYNAIYAALFSILRYRVPMMPWVILFAALTITRLVPTHD